MSELKRNQSLFSQRAPGARKPCRASPVRDAQRPVTGPAEQRLLEPFEMTAGQGGDPYNGVGSRVAAAPPASRK